MSIPCNPLVTYLWSTRLYPIEVATRDSNGGSIAAPLSRSSANVPVVIIVPATKPLSSSIQIRSLGDAGVLASGRVDRAVESGVGANDRAAALAFPVGHHQRCAVGAEERGRQTRRRPWPPSFGGLLHVGDTSWRCQYSIVWGSSWESFTSANPSSVGFQRDVGHRRPGLLALDQPWRRGHSDIPEHDRCPARDRELASVGREGDRLRKFLRDGRQLPGRDVEQMGPVEIGERHEPRVRS